MSSSYTGNRSHVTPGASVTITIPSDGDGATAASVNNPGPFEQLADYAAYAAIPPNIFGPTSFATHWSSPGASFNIVSQYINPQREYIIEGSATAASGASGANVQVCTFSVPPPGLEMRGIAASASSVSRCHVDTSGVLWLDNGGGGAVDTGEWWFSIRGYS